MARRSLLQASAWLLAFALLPWAPLSAQDLRGGGDEGGLLRFASVSFDPLAGPLPAGVPLSDAGAAGPFVVQFPYPLTGAERGLIEAAGGQVAAYVPDGGFVVLGRPGFARTLQGLPGARFVGLLGADLRLAPGAERASTVMALFGGGLAAMLEDLARVDAHTLVLGQGFAIVSPPGGARALATLPHLLWVEPYGEPEAANYRAVLTDGIRQAANGSAYSPLSGALWTFNPSPSGPRFLGYTGAGVSIDITDEGVDGNHPAFAGRLGAARSWSATPTWVDRVGHGTHVAGSALGDGSYLASDAGGPLGLYAGAAPGATLVAQSYDSAAMNYSGMAQFASSTGALASVNSWGDLSLSAQGAYTAVAATYDALTADASPEAGVQPLLFVFSAGNLDNAAGSVTSPGTAKNVLSVGATGNDLPGGTASGDVAPFSAFGPADDARIKPDLVAPGERIASANSSSRTSPTSAPYPPLGGSSYTYLSGTSQAAPQVGGAAAVAGEFLLRTRGVLATPALLKALLINGASPLPGYDWPGPAQGWGRLDLAASLLDSPSRKVEFVEEGNHTFFTAPDVVEYRMGVRAGEELRVTLAWTDPAGSPLAASALVNDLDLEVRDENDSVIFAGNDINRTSGTSRPGAGLVFDRVNNVEAVRIPAAPGGTWRIFVRAHSLPQAPQTFSLAISGGIDRPEVRLEPRASPLTASLREGENDVPVVLANRGASGTVRAPTVEGAYAGWTYSVVPPNVTVEAGGNATFHLLVNTSANLTARVAYLNLSFYPESSREGELRLPVALTLTRSPPPPPPPVSPWPSDPLPLLAVALGAVGALGAALTLAPRRGLASRCPACGFTPPRFDTFMNPTCAECGGSLQRQPHPPR